MVILYLYDALNGHRRRVVSLEYYARIAHSTLIVSAWIVPAAA